MTTSPSEMKQVDWTEKKTHRKGNAMTQLNRLQLSQTIQLAEWLKSQPVYEDGTSLHVIAENASRDLPFQVTGYNIKTVAGAAEIQLPASKKPKADALADLNVGLANALSRIDRIEAYLRQLHEKQAV